MDAVIEITDGLAIPASELDFRVSRSSGPGGQGVNTTDSRVELRFDVAASPSLSEEQRERLLQRLASRIDTTGTLRIVAQTHRSQLQNRREAVSRFQTLLAEALRPPPPRVPTRPSPASRRRREAAKRHRADLKQARRPPAGEE